jgi:hypothetical protein
VTGPRIIATARDLAAAAAAVPPATPVLISDNLVEPGASDQDWANWVVLAEQKAMPVNDTGAIAGPGERIGIYEHIDDDGTVLPHLAGTTALVLYERHLAVPGVIGPTAVLADPEQRRDDAYEEHDGDLTRYLMELVDVVAALRDEVSRSSDDDAFAKAARRRLRIAAEALEAARAAISEATTYGLACELARLAVDDDQPCDPAHLHGVTVDVPTLGYDEIGCPRHAAALITKQSGAAITKATPAAIKVLAAILSDGDLPPQEPPAQPGERNDETPT